MATAVVWGVPLLVLIGIAGAVVLVGEMGRVPHGPAAGMLGLASFTLFFAVWTRFAVSSLRRKRLGTRESLRDDEIFRRFYEPAGFAKDHTLELWHDVAKAFRVPSGLLRPSDRLADLTVTNDSLTDHASEDLLFAGKARAKRLGVIVPPSAFETVDAYVRAFSTPVTSR